MSAIQRAIESIDPPTQVELARRLAEHTGEEITPQAISQWVRNDRTPPERCIAVEEVIGAAVTRYDLRPDVFGAPPTKKKKAA